MARRKPFEQYRQTTKQQRIIQRNIMASLVKTKGYRKWIKWAYRMQHGECFYCDELISLNDRKSYHIEHRIPIYYGGLSEYSNLCLACPDCNRVKATDQLIRNKAHLNRANESRKLKGTKPVIYL